MNKFFVIMLILVFSWLVGRMLENIMGKSIALTSFFKKYQLRIILGMTVVLVLVPFILLWILGDSAIIVKVIQSFLISLLISVAFWFTLEYIESWFFDNKVRTGRKIREILYVQETSEYNNDLRTSIELKTLERFGLNSAVGVSFDSLNRLGNQYSELVMLEREIDELATKPI